MIITVQSPKKILQPEYNLRAAKLLQQFNALGFKSYNAFRYVVRFELYGLYDLNQELDGQLFKFWSTGMCVNNELCDALEIAIENLKNE